MTVLIADDSLTALRDMEAKIQGMGEIDEVILCSDSVLALDIIRHKNVDIVIMDEAMSGRDGMELLGNIRKDTSLDGVQVILLTPEAESMKEGFSLGYDDFIMKPVGLVELRSHIKALVKAKKPYVGLRDEKNDVPR